MWPETGGAFELIFLAAIALVVVGPKDLPVLLRKLGQFVAKMRGLAAEFRASFDELARQSELDELRKEVEALKTARMEPQLHEDIGATLNEIHGDIHSSLSAPLPNPALADPNLNVMRALDPATPAQPEPAPKVRRSRSTKKPAFEPAAEAAEPKRAAKTATAAAKPARKRAAKASPPLAERTG